MKRSVQFLGIFGLIAILFGLLTQLLVTVDEWALVPIHLIVGIVCLGVFLLGGGVSALGGAAAKRAAGVGAGIVAYSAIFLGLVAAVNYLVLRHDPVFLDTTSEKVYTLAPQTVQTLESLQKPVMARAFYVGKIDAEAEALLNRYAKASPKFHWQLIDPEKRPKLMDEFGISQSATVHFSFEGEPAGHATRLVRDINEQEITNSILKLRRGGEKSVYALTGHGEADFEKASEAGFLFLKEAIEGENLKLQKLSFSDTHVIPEDASAILVLAPRKQLLPVERDAITDYLKRGGRAFFAAEPRTTTDVAELVKPLGITVGNNVVVDQVVGLFSGPGLGVQPLISSFGKHPSVEGFDKNIALSTAASVRRAASVPAGADVAELAFTGKNAWAETDLTKLFGEEPTASRDPDDVAGPVPIAAAFAGQYPSEGGAAPADGQRVTRVVVVGDIDWLANVNLRKLYNADFFLNLLNWTVGQGEGVTIRANSRKMSRAVITNEQFSAMFLLTGILLPEFLLAGGLGIWWIRKRA